MTLLSKLQAVFRLHVLTDSLSDEPEDLNSEGQ